MAECYTLLLKLKDLPKGVYDPLEAAWADEGLGKFAGGLGAVIIVRYSDTPVGMFAVFKSHLLRVLLIVLHVCCAVVQRPEL